MRVHDRKAAEAQKAMNAGIAPAWDLLDFEEIWQMPFYNLSPEEGSEE